MRHPVLKWAWFLFLFFGLPILHFGCWLVCSLMTRSLRSLITCEVQWAAMSRGDVCFACLAWPYQLFVGMLISLMKAYTGCGRATLNFIECFDLGWSVPKAKPLHLMSAGHSICTESNCLAWMWTQLRCFAFFVLSYLVLPFFVLFYVTQVVSENLTLVLNVKRTHKGWFTRTTQS